MEGDEIEWCASATGCVVLAVDGMIEKETKPVAVRSASYLWAADCSIWEGTPDACYGVIVEGEILLLGAVPVGDVGFVPDLVSVNAH